LRKAGKSATAINREHCNTSHTSEKKRKQRERNRGRETEGGKWRKGDREGKGQELTTDAK